MIDNYGLMRQAAARRFIALLLLAQVWPVLTVGQSQLVLRYDPVRDVANHTLFQTVARIVPSRGPAIETADLGSMRAVALELADGGTVLHMAYDSVRARVRSDGGMWREFVVPGVDSVWAQASIDSLLDVTALRTGPRPPEVTGLLDIVTGIPHLTLPEQAVRIGGAWLVESKLSERVAASVPEEFGKLPSLTFSTRITLDSIVRRSQDTLGYFALSGDVRPTDEVDLRALAEAGIAVTSELEGQLVWSTGWRGFVSGANRVTMEISRSRPSATPIIERREPDLTLHVTTRFRVQP